MRFPLSLKLAPAAALKALLLLGHAAAALVLLQALATSGPPPSALAPEFIAVSGWAVIGLSLLLSLHAENAKRGLALILHEDGVLSLLRGGVRQDYRIDGSAVDFGWALWLPLQDAAASGARCGRICRRLMLLPANLPAGQWRALRIWLRHKAVGAAESDLP